MEKEARLTAQLNTPKTLAEVLTMIYHQFDNALLIRVLTAVADKVAQLHHAGFSIEPLTNDVICLQLNTRDHSIDVTVAEKSLGTSEAPLTWQQRGQQLAGINLPDDYWRILKYMYFSNQAMPDEFSDAADVMRQSLRSENPSQLIAEKNIWLWDENSAQAMIVLHRKAKKSLRRKRDNLKLLLHNLIMLPRIWFGYKRLIRTAYKKPITLTNRIGIALHPEYWPQENELLLELSCIPVLIRFYCHEAAPQWQASIELIQELRHRNIRVMVALVQNRNAVIDSSSWQSFLDAIIPQVHDLVDWIEVGHASNRVKWGIWNAKEYANLLHAVYVYKKTYPKLRLIGPAVIDFEWYKIIDILKTLPKRIKLQALSQHLYVDRRGAPENFQGKFSSIEKCALAKAIAISSGQCEPHFIISEFNWPIKETGVYSPIGSPYMAPEWFRDNPGVTETEYAEYLIRYLTIALCSGFVEQAVIWRLSAHGYGLVDDRDGFRKRAAFFALQTYLQLLGDAKFISKRASQAGDYLFEFQTSSATITLAWTTQMEKVITIAGPAECCIDLYGQPLQQSGPHVTLSASPIYTIQEQP